MSTSSGRGVEGDCVRCGHSMEGHAKLRDTKCKKCKKSFEVCQAGIHGNDGAGWRICFVPCSCGEKYFPLSLTKKHELAGHEYQENHPGYRPLTPEIDETTDEPSSVSREVMESFTNMKISESRHSRDRTLKPPKRWTPPPWSDWIWEGEYSRYYRYRATESGDFEYEYDNKTSKALPKWTAPPWSDWIWEGEYSRYYRSRVMESGEFEYEYDITTPAPRQEKEKEREKGEDKRNPGSEDELGWDQRTFDQHTQPWSEWAWDEGEGCYYRTRMDNSGEYEYQYDYKSSKLPKEKGKGKGKGKRK